LSGYFKLREAVVCNVTQGTIFLRYFLLSSLLFCNPPTFSVLPFRCHKWREEFSLVSGSESDKYSVFSGKSLIAAVKKCPKPLSTTNPIIFLKKKKKQRTRYCVAAASTVDYTAAFSFCYHFPKIGIYKYVNGTNLFNNYRLYLYFI